jgi:recombination protein RecA
MSIESLYEKFKDKYEIEEKPPKDVVSTGSVLLDRALTIGGYASGRIIEIYGPEGAGKTTLALHAMAEAQRKGWDAAIIDMEAGLDVEYAKSVGVKGKPNVDYLHLIPSWGEQAIDELIDTIEAGVRLIVVDSVAAMVPKAEYEGDTGEAFMGLQARMMGQALRKITTRVEASGAVLIFINQVRSKIGVFFGSPETTTGGRALPFYSSMRIQVKQGDQIKSKQDIIGKYLRCKIIKNKLGPPLKECQVPIVFGQGIDSARELLEELQVKGILTKRSSYFYYGEEKWLGVDSLLEDMKKDIKTWRKRLTAAS